MYILFNILIQFASMPVIARTTTADPSGKLFTEIKRILLGA